MNVNMHTPCANVVQCSSLIMRCLWNMLQVGDFVKISSDVEKVKEYQTGHGEWVESMIHVSTECEP